jgi:hypothetical protein
MDSLHRSKHLWCLKRCKEASIDRRQDKQKGAKAKGLASNCALRRDRCLLISKQGEEASKANKQEARTSSYTKLQLAAL